MVKDSANGSEICRVNTIAIIHDHEKYSLIEWFPNEGFAYHELLDLVFLGWRVAEQDSMDVERSLRRFIGFFSLHNCKNSASSL